MRNGSNFLRLQLLAGRRDAEEERMCLPICSM